MLKIGDLAPILSFKTTTGESMSLKDWLGQYIVVYFYPKAFTYGCTRESIEFERAIPLFEQYHARILGVSTDEQDKQCNFAKEHGIHFPLVADSLLEVSRAFGVYRPILGVAKRATFIIDPQGVIAAVFHHEIFVQQHVKDVKQFLEAHAKT